MNIQWYGNYFLLEISRLYSGFLKQTCKIRASFARKWHCYLLVNRGKSKGLVIRSWAQKIPIRHGKKWFNLHWLQYSYFSIFCRNMEGIYFKCFVVVTDSSVARLVFYICFISPYISDKYFCIYVNLFFTRIFKVYTCCHYQHYFCCCYQQIL